MKEKRPLVWLSTVHPVCALTEPELRGWQLNYISIAGQQCLKSGARVDPATRVGVLSLNTLTNTQLAKLPDWLNSLPVQQWVAILEPHQLQDPDVCCLITGYCRDYHTRPVSADRLNATLGHLWGMSQLHSRTRCDRPVSYHDFAMDGESQAIRQVRDLLLKFACTEEPIIIYGESGTGKESAARFVHDHSPRKNQPLVVVNCAALPRSLTQNELFGHEKGAFTDAMSTQKGRIEAANGGTLLLIGIDELSQEQQSTILRFLQEGVIERLGAHKAINVDVRFIATSSRPLEELLHAGIFRSDVFYRLGGLKVVLPPLRDRREDIPTLANSILSSRTRKPGSQPLSEHALTCLAKQPWPGNLRELQNRLRQALALHEGSQITAEDLGFDTTTCTSEDTINELSLDAYRSQADRQAISVSLALANNNVSAAARLLKISRVSLYRLMEKHQFADGAHGRGLKNS